MKTTSLRALPLAETGFFGRDRGAETLGWISTINRTETRAAHGAGGRIAVADWHKRREEVVK